jgi:hypothetical protein
MADLARAAWLALPVVLAGLTHVAVLRARFFPGLARPLDGGLHLRGRRLLGDNKTWRGAIVLPAAAAGWSALLPAPAPGAALGALLGLGYIVGELPNSFLKRQLDIAPGAPAAGAAAPLFWLVDQVDSLVGVVAVLALAAPTSPAVVAWLLLITLLLHPAVAALMVLLRLKARVG